MVTSNDDDSYDTCIKQGLYYFQTNKKKENTLLKIIPGSQLLLPVGTTGLRAKGNRPNPEPGRIIRNRRFSWNKNISV